MTLVPKLKMGGREINERELKNISSAFGICRAYPLELKTVD
jgi:hypothetical protein